MKTAVAVRRGREGDRDFVRDLGRRSASASISSVREARFDDVVGAFDRLVDFVFGREHECLVAAEGETRIGFLLMLYDLPDEVTLTEQAFVAYTAVEPFARGRGVGRALLESAETLARARGRRWMSRMVTEENVPARSLYDDAGFVTERRMMTKPL
jgi:ribosomal protein S18 acetylase RimI-like enzyme